MYLDHFGLREPPFSITPDPRFLYLSRQHRDALAHLLHGSDEAGSFMLLTGEVGTGKTLLCRTLLDQPPPDIRFALLLNPLLTPLELLAAICDEFGVTYPPGTQSRKNLIDRLNLFLLKAHGEGQRPVVVIDEAQNLSTETLEQIRLLTNLETGSHKLLKILLIGQPELLTVLRRPELRQLDQRITARYHLGPLDRRDTAGYVQHRLRVAGATRPLFRPAALRQVHRESGGVPRLINVICERALAGAYALDRAQVDARLVRRAAREVRGGAPRHPLAPALLAGALTVSAVAIGALAWQRHHAPRPAGTPAASGLIAVPARAVAADPEPPADEPPPEDAPAATPPAPAPPTLGALLAQGVDNAAAFDALFRRWRLAPPTAMGGTPCEQAAAAGLQCLFEQGGLAALRRHDRPAVLELHDGPRTALVAALALDGDTITLQAGAQRLTVPLDELARWWDGDFVILWRPPVAGLDTVAEGYRGPATAWIASALAATGLAPAGHRGDRFDAALARAVRRFQRARGLHADGIVGPQTFIALANAAHRPDRPHLRAEED